MPIPNNQTVQRVMEFLVDRTQAGGIPLVLVDDLKTTCLLSHDEYQSIFQLFFQAGVFRPIGIHQLQIDPLVQEYAPRVPFTSLNDVLQYFRGHKSRRRLVGLLGAISSLYIQQPDETTDRLLIVCPDVESELIAYCAKSPEALFSLTPRKFEELVAAIFRNNNFEVELTPQTRDGGIDIIAVERSIFTGTSIHFIECKRYAPENRVGISVVQRLASVVNQKRGTRGIVVTTSSFTNDAKAAAREMEHSLALKDYNDLVLWLRKLTGHSGKI